MIEHAIATLESAVHDIRTEHQQTVDVWEALETVRSAGASHDHVDEFWRGAAVVTHPVHGGYQHLNASMNGICRRLGVVRTYHRLSAED